MNASPFPQGPGGWNAGFLPGRPQEGQGLWGPASQKAVLEPHHGFHPLLLHRYLGGRIEGDDGVYTELRLLQTDRAMGAEWRKSRLSTEYCPQKGQDFPNYQPGHTAAAALPGLATWPPAPQGYVRHYQKQHLGLESSFSFFSFFFCSKGKEVYGKSRRAMEVSVPQG